MNKAAEMEESGNWRALAEERQKQYFAIFGSRPYDEIEKSNLFLLKKKVGFATCGKPKYLPSPKNYNTGYDLKSLVHIKRICKQIIKKSDSDPIRFACTMLSLHYEGDIRDTPVFRIVTDNGNIFIDTEARVYSSWIYLMEHIKLPDCEYCFPVKGEYNLNEVKVGFAYSPASSRFSKTLSSLDTVGSIASLAAAGVCTAGLMVTVAPVAIAAASITAACTGAYGTTRSVATLVDRLTHEQSISLKDREARSAWFRIGSTVVGVAKFKAVDSAKKSIEGGKSLTKLKVYGAHALNGTSLVLNGFGFFESLFFCVDNYQNGLLTKKHVFDLVCETIFLFNAIASAKATRKLLKSMNVTVVESPSVQKKMTETQKENCGEDLEQRSRKSTHEDTTRPAQHNSTGIKYAFDVFIANFDHRLEEILYACQSIGHDIKCWKSNEMSITVLLANIAMTAVQLYKSFKEEIKEALPKICKYFESLTREKLLKDISSLFANAVERVKKLFCAKVVNMEDEVHAMMSEAKREVTVCQYNLGLEVTSSISDSSRTNDNSDDGELTPETQKLLSRCVDVTAKASLPCNELEQFEAILEEVKHLVVATFKAKISNYKKSLAAAKSVSGESFDINKYHMELGIQDSVGQSMFDSTLEELTNSTVIYKIKTKLTQRNCDENETAAMCTAVWESVTDGVFHYFGPHGGGKLTEAQILSLASAILKSTLSSGNCYVLRKENMFMIEVPGETSKSDRRTVVAYQEISEEKTASVMMMVYNSE